MAGIFDRKESMDGLAEQLKPRFMTRGERVSVVVRRTRINRNDVYGSCTFETYLRITTWRDTSSHEVSRLGTTVPYGFYTTVHSARHNSRPGD